MIIVGTSAATNLPNQVVHLAARTGAVIIDINIDHNPFSEVASALDKGLALQGRAGDELPRVVNALINDG